MLYFTLNTHSCRIHIYNNNRCYYKIGHDYYCRDDMDDVRIEKDAGSRPPILGGLGCYSIPGKLHAHDLGRHTGAIRAGKKALRDSDCDELRFCKLCFGTRRSMRLEALFN